MRNRAAEVEILLGVDVKPCGAITGWHGWPDDVRPLLMKWNRGDSDRPMKLSFVRRALFDCSWCGERCEGVASGGAVLNGDPYCDDCLILIARSEPPLLEKASEDG